MLAALYSILVLVVGSAAIICASLVAVALTNILAASAMTYRDDRLLLAWSLPCTLLFVGTLLLMLGYI
jgi:hypothetical protein